MSDRNDEQWEELSLAREKFIQALAKKYIPLRNLTVHRQVVRNCSIFGSSNDTRSDE